MANFIFNVILWAFALYGFLEIVKTIIHTYYHPKFSSNGIYLFIAVKNQENSIEGFLRSLLFRYIYGKEDLINNIFVVDLKSCDKTNDILTLISSDYDCIDKLDLKKCKEVLDSIYESK